MPDDEKRKFTRIPFETTVKVTVGERTIVSRQLRDVSLGGAYIIAPETFPAGTVCELEFELRGPRTLLVIWIEGEVVRSEDSGMALRFTKTDLDSLLHLRYLMRVYSGDPKLIEKEFRQDLLEIRERPRTASPEPDAPVGPTDTSDP